MIALEGRPAQLPQEVLAELDKLGYYERTIESLKTELVQKDEQLAKVDADMKAIALLQKGLKMLVHDEAQSVQQTSNSEIAIAHSILAQWEPKLNRIESRIGQFLTGQPSKWFNVDDVLVSIKARPGGYANAALHRLATCNLIERRSREVKWRMPA